MKPHEAVRAADQDLNNEPEYSIEAGVDLAIKKLGDDLESYQNALVRAALRKKLTDVLGRMPRSAGNAAVPQMALFENLPEIRVRLRGDDGQELYWRFANMRWPQVAALQEERRRRREREHADPLEQAIGLIEPIMMDDPNLTVEEAVKKLAQDAA